LRIPRKKELLELQRKYRTDKRIGEVYGVPTRLVTYWRSKKKIGSYSFPKYTEDKIQELWERFGDDGRAGEELGISKAGFRQWRRKYDINQKPRQLKLEQLELPLLDANHRKNSRHETIIEKILAKKSGLRKVDIGDVVNIDPDLMISYDNTGDVIHYFNQIGCDRIWDPGKSIIALDHMPRTEHADGLCPHKAIREFVRKRKIKNFYDVGQGIPQQVILESGHVLPGQLILTSDNQASAFGCVGAFSVNVDALDIAAAWASGRLWLRVPETVKISINGRLTRGVYARDAILKIIRDMKSDGVNYKTVEFYGSAVSSMSVSERFTMASLFSGIGAKSAIIPFDDVTARYLKKMIKSKFTPVIADPEAVYCNEIDLDVNYLTPQVACSRGGGYVQSIEEIAGKKVDQVVLGGCANGRIDDLESAVRILRGHRINRDVRMFVIPASRKVYSEALDRGFIRTFIDSGCVILSPGCGSCLKAHRETLEPGERALTTSVDGCKQNNGESGGEIYMASPATAAATALEGAIADPRKYIK
jgi:3-isopropylmalate/(R)-2-methylmalate dehydratase large subunit